MVEVRKVLANNEILCIPGDRVTGGEPSRLLPFFGKNARFPSGPFMFGSITGAPIIAVFCVKQRPRHYLLKVYGSISFDGVRRDMRNQAVDKAMKEYVAILENIARKYPCQWFNLYDYWE
jgi:predicted LPLAT superfamily acyltransferase